MRLPLPLPQSVLRGVRVGRVRPRTRVCQRQWTSTWAASDELSSGNQTTGHGPGKSPFALFCSLLRIARSARLGQPQPSSQPSSLTLWRQISSRHALAPANTRQANPSHLDVHMTADLLLRSCVDKSRRSLSVLSLPSFRPHSIGTVTPLSQSLRQQTFPSRRNAQPQRLTSRESRMRRHS